MGTKIVSKLNKIYFGAGKFQKNYSGSCHIASINSLNLYTKSFKIF